MRLCLALGYPTIDKAQEHIDAKAFALWKAYFLVQDRHNIDYRADIRSAIVASTIANAHRASNSDAVKPSDMMLFFDKEPEPFVEQTEEQIAAALGAR